MPNEQNQIIDALKTGRPFALPASAVHVIETHAAYVFLVGPDAYKVKKAIRLAYLDYSTLAARQRMCLREIEVNRATAGDLYIDVLPITRDKNGAVSLAGDGEVVEWAVHMRRFPQGALLSGQLANGPLDTELADALARQVFAMHARAARITATDGCARLLPVVDQIKARLEAAGSDIDADAAAGYIALAGKSFTAARFCLRLRARRGAIRRCHGDLHSGNIVLLDGRPTPFDAIEFDDDLATVDVLYDLAFLLMDLITRGDRRAANIVLNRYLWLSAVAIDIYGLAALGLFMGLRAGVRAIVALDRAGQTSSSEHTAALAEANRDIAAGIALMTPCQPRLIAVAGLSGTGKSTLARALAPDIGAAPGALILRSDIERKSLFGVEETAPLAERFYSRDCTARVYDQLMQKARIALKAGHSVIVDAVFAAGDERSAVEELAASLDVAFTGLWLTAPQDVLVTRVRRRHGDASDADERIVRMQHQLSTGSVSWPSVDASGDPARTLANARAVLNNEKPPPDAAEAASSGGCRDQPRE